MSSGQLEHASVLLDESVSAVVTQRDGIYVDATFGRGGHSKSILNSLSADGRLIVIDKDPRAIDVARGLAEADGRVEVCHGSFARLHQLLDGLEVGFVDGVLADLGVSSPQLDDPERGFSFQSDGPLDMRMDISSGLTAEQYLAQVDEAELARVLREYGEERYSKRIASAIVNARDTLPISTTAQLAKIVSEANPSWEKNKHPATRSFQAIRISLNKELEDLEVFLEGASKRLKVGGRLSVISFHSLEDRIVKRFMSAKVKGVQPPPGVPIMDKEISRFFKLHSKAIKPSEGEIAGNIRARSAILRSLEKVSYE